MRISRIRLLGFKSFAQRTELELDPGITAIVGPNGCGKSNVVDAVKWVLGEQKPSTLRAKEMLDVIFAGTDRRKPLGMAEVSLILDNGDGKLSVDLAEVVLTRRLFRSGESEYLLNGESCRLKDLRDILMDTGGGLDALSIMEQGKIDAILTANPVDRRTVFEEAAGIGRFKARRKETLRRLERVGEDLTRLRDVIELTEKQLRSLRYQASRARRFHELSETLKRKRVTWALYRYHTLLSERESLTTRLAEAAVTEAAMNKRLREILDELSTEERSVQDLSARAREADAQLFEITSEVRAARQRAVHETTMAAELGDRIRWCENEIRVTERRIQERTAEADSLSDELAALTAEAAVREAELRAAEEVIEAARAERTAAEAGLEEVKGERVALLEESTSLRNERAALGAALRSRRAESDRLAARRAAVVEERRRAEQEHETVAASLAGKREVEEDLRGRLAAAEEEAAEVERRLEDLGAQEAELDRSLSGSRSRLDLLESMKARHEGMDQSVAKILVESKREGSALPGIHGVVADIIHVAAAESDLVELALGACSQAVVTESLADAVRAIGWLKERRLGRAYFLPLDQLRAAGPTYMGNGEARKLLGAVEAADPYRRLVEALLSDSILVDDVDAALAVSRDHGGRLRIVTGGGEVMNRIGGISGGVGRNPVALMSRNVEIRELTESIRKDQERREVLAEMLEGMRSRRADTRGEIRTLREELEIAGRVAREAETAAERLARDLRRMADEARVLKAELAELEGSREADRTRDAELSVREAELEEMSRALAATAEERGKAVELATLRSREAGERRTEIRIVLAGARERVAGAESRLSDLREGLRDARRNVELLRAEGESSKGRREEAARAAEEAEKAAEKGEREQKRRETAASEVRREHEEARGRLLSRRESSEELREEHEAYRSSLEEFRLKEQEARTKLEDLLDRVREEFGLDLEDMYQGFRPEEVDWQALDAEVGDLKGKLDRMGNVNLEALDQLAEVEERVKFLRGEEEDLLKSREELLSILRKVNRESRERFEKSFSEIRANFREMVRKLFGGGNADILLTEGEDVLEAGIEIVVRPPSRELQNLNLLSGGEKTLTAVALLFAIFKTRPSPFALMDEVDAALDESNIDRFLSVLRDFTSTSQFIIITHNKRTMGEADALYGVTMPEPGVSRPMSIRFSSIGESAPEAATGAPAAP